MNKYTRRKINGSDIRLDAGDNVVIENHHQPIIGYRTFVTTRAPGKALPKQLPGCEKV